MFLIHLIDSGPKCRRRTLGQQKGPIQHNLDPAFWGLTRHFRTFAKIRSLLPQVVRDLAAGFLQPEAQFFLCACPDSLFLEVAFPRQQRRESRFLCGQACGREGAPGLPSVEQAPD
jgi:hypothetical protein